MLKITREIQFVAIEDAGIDLIYIIMSECKIVQKKLPMFTSMWTRDNTNLGDAIATMEVPNGNRSIVRVNMERQYIEGQFLY